MVRLAFDPASPHEVEEARKLFTSCTKEGCLAFACDPDGEKGRQIFEFEPASGLLILVPPIKPTLPTGRSRSGG